MPSCYSAYKLLVNRPAMNADKSQNSVISLVLNLTSRSQSSPKQSLVASKVESLMVSNPI